MKQHIIKNLLTERLFFFRKMYLLIISFFPKLNRFLSTLLSLLYFAVFNITNLPVFLTL